MLEIVALLPQYPHGEDLNEGLAAFVFQLQHWMGTQRATAVYNEHSVIQAFKAYYVMQFLPAVATAVLREASLNPSKRWEHYPSVGQHVIDAFGNSELPANFASQPAAPRQP